MTQERKNSRDRSALAELGLRPLSARSVLLSLLLGTNPPRLPVGRLVRAAGLFAINDGAARTALSRLAAAGDVAAEDGWYRLNSRFDARQARQAWSLTDPRQPWDGGWWMVVVTAERRAAAERAQLRQAMAERRYGELREGLWARPANLAGPDVGAGPLAPTVAGQTSRWSARPDGDPAVLCAALWPLDAWAARSRALLAAYRRQGHGADLAEQITVSAATLHHLLSDPLLPDEVAPRHWPAAELRHEFARYYRDQQAELRAYLTAPGAATPPGGGGGG